MRRWLAVDDHPEFATQIRERGRLEVSGPGAAGRRGQGATAPAYFRGDELVEFDDRRTGGRERWQRLQEPALFVGEVRVQPLVAIRLSDSVFGEHQGYQPDVAPCDCAVAGECQFTTTEYDGQIAEQVVVEVDGLGREIRLAVRCRPRSNSGRQRTDAVDQWPTAAKRILVESAYGMANDVEVH